jgi:ribosomal protein L11
VIVPATGADGIKGCALITTFTDAAEVHPLVLVTVKVYVPSERPETVVLTPVPPVSTAPGERVRVHVPAGKPLSTTLPVGTAQIGWPIVPAMGAEGVKGCALITILTDCEETHPALLVTV